MNDGGDDPAGKATIRADFPVVGIGASAGGIEALEGFFSGLPASPGAAFIIVTHLSPERESHLHEIMARFTNMPVHVAADGVDVAADHVYVMPADAVISIKNRRLRMRPPGNRRERRPIDIFLSALAIDRGEMAAGVVLSGGDGDGTLGIKAIKERGGLTLAQVANGSGPQYSSMPDSAISTGYVDFAVPAHEMGGKIVDFARGLQDGTALLGIAGATEESPIEEVIPEIFGILHSQIGHDFSGYKTNTFMRRVQRRIHVTQTANLDNYIELLRREPKEVNALFRDLLINVTNFFRDADAFDDLSRLVVPKLFEGRGVEDIVRVWVPGCATGEEVFSIAMLLREHMDTLSAVPRVQIFATDIDERALMVARAARYPAALLDSVSVERRRRFFVNDGGSYMVCKEVRELCIFSPHSVIRDPPFSRIDLVSCRNLLIYFGLDVQAQVIPTFHYALRPDGYLFLGLAENVSQFDDLFLPIEKKHRIFRRRTDAASPVRLPMLVSLRAGRALEAEPHRPVPGGITLRTMIDEHVLDHFAPPRVVVNREGDVIYYSNRTGKYLEAPPGAPTRQLLTLARKGLRLDLRTMFQEALETGNAVTRDRLALETGENVQMVSVTIEPLNDHAGGPTLYLVLFRDQGKEVTRDEAFHRAREVRDGSAIHLERELRATRDRLQSLIEEYETALEELKSSNEELVSVNEEMQSTNEELEASKEELQSVNEELQTVNGELNGKIEALDRANNDLQNLFNSTDVATVFLDRNLLIRSFTPAVGKIFNILPGDRGRPITDLSSRLNLTAITAKIMAILAGASPLEQLIDDVMGTAHYLVRVAPYRDRDGRIEGVVITFVDITKITHAEARQRLLVAELQHRTRNLLAIVQSVAQRTLGKSEPVAAFASRLAALGRVQSLLSQTGDDQVELGEIVRLELQAMGPANNEKVLIDGPEIFLGAELVQTFGLALHELATNALKYGALAQPAGRLEIAWEVQETPRGTRNLVLDWRESHVDMPARGTANGFGRQMIEHALTFTLRAKTELNFAADGVSCRIEIPLPITAAATILD